MIVRKPPANRSFILYLVYVILAEKESEKEIKFYIEQTG